MEKNVIFFLNKLIVDATKDKMMKLHEYLDHERFNAREYEKNLDNLSKYRIAWTTAN